MPPVFDDLPPEERARRYREMAEHTRALADRVDNPTLRQSYLELSGRWRSLAEGTESRFDPSGDQALRPRGPEAI